MILKTKRLTLKLQQAGDAPALFMILKDAQAMRFWNRPPIARLAVVEEQLREQLAAMAAGLCQYWTVHEGADVVGSVDLSLIQDGAAELGFLLRRDRWGFGLASEAAVAVVAHAFGPLDLTRLAAAIQTENVAAARVLEKNRFARIDRRNVAIASGEIRDCTFYLLRRAQSATANGR